MPHFWYLVSVHKMEITTSTKWKPSVKEGFGKKKKSVAMRSIEQSENEESLKKG